MATPAAKRPSWPPFTGRHTELERLLGVLGQVMLQRGTLVLLSGEAGIGKTRLTNEFEDRANNINCVCTVGHCIPGMPSPYLPFKEAFEGILKRREDEANDVGAKEARPDRARFMDESWPADRILFSSLELVKRKSAIMPLIVILEDLHWADTASIQLLHFLARNAVDLKLMLIGTYRPEDLVPDHSGNPHPLTDTLRIMRREGLCEEIALRSMDPPDIESLTAGVLGGPLDPAVLDKVVVECDGNPLFAIEIVRLLASNGSIEFVAGRWNAREKVQIEIPSSVREVILRRLDRITKPQRKILEFASVSGSKFNLGSLESCCGIDRYPLLEELDSIEREYHLIRHAGQSLVFEHENIRQVLYDTISAPRRKEIHRLLGEYLEANPGPESSAEALATHFHLAGVTQKCVRYSVEAGERCLGKGAATEAIPYLDQALGCAGKDAAYDGEVLRAYESLASANILMGRYDTAANYLDRVVKKTGLERASARTLRDLAECWGGIHLGKGDQTKSLRYLDLAEAAARDDPKELGEIAGVRASMMLHDGNLEAAKANYRKAISACRASNNDEGATNNMARLSSVYLTEGDVEEALAQADDALRLAGRTPGYYAELEATYHIGMVYFHIGNTKEAIRMLGRSADIGYRIGEYTGLCWGLTFLSLAYDDTGDLESCALSAKRSYESAQTTESAFIMLNGISGLLHATVRKGELEEAERLYEKSLAIEKDFRWGMHSSTRCILTMGRAEYQAAKGNWDECSALFSQAFEQMRGTPEGLLLEAISRVAYGRILMSRDDAEGAKAQLSSAKAIYGRLRNHPGVDRTAQLLKALG